MRKSRSLDELQQRLPLDVFTGLRLAREVGARRLGLELQAFRLLDTGYSLKAITAQSIDRAKASAAVQGVLGRIRSSQRAGASFETAKAAGARRLRVVAATEASQAFNGERLEVARAVHVETALYRVWDSTLDKHTCPTCAGMEGTMVPVRENFAAGEPGYVHPLCRCEWSIVPVRIFSDLAA